MSSGVVTQFEHCVYSRRCNNTQKVQHLTILDRIQLSNAKISVQSESRRQITVHLENELSALSSSFSKWIGAQKSYFQALDNWLQKCVSIAEKSSKRKSRIPTPPLRNFGPPIYVTYGVWLEKVGTLKHKDVVDTVKALAAETTRFLPRQDKKDDKSATLPNLTSWKADNNSDSAVNGLRDEASEDFISGFDHFRSNLVAFFGELNVKQQVDERFILYRFVVDAMIKVRPFKVFR
ncbi:hypothetical protein TorRG33x02_188900 [Trema orientale]|uniref:DUF632 domain-containing protein n=1 Tax=Trema orientale TaxID=63057 RepID=A0A2P5EI42_TREOI|nr:hypothetical protein TorRG33x02_188900 [Trema orientale]